MIKPLVESSQIEINSAIIGHLRCLLHCLLLHEGVRLVGKQGNNVSRFIYRREGRMRTRR